MHRIIVLIFSLFLTCQLSAQTHVVNYKIDKGRILWHDKIDKQQKLLTKQDGKDDNMISLSQDETVNQLVEYALIKGIDEAQQEIEQDTTLSHSNKVKYLLGLEDLLKGFNNNIRKKDFPFTNAQALLDGYLEGVELDRKGQSIEPVIASNPYGVGAILMETFLFRESKSAPGAKNIVIRK